MVYCKSVMTLVITLCLRYKTEGKTKPGCRFKNTYSFSCSFGVPPIEPGNNDGPRFT